MLTPVFRHMEWADAVVWCAVAALPPDDTLREKLHHVHMVQHAYAAMWVGKTPSPVPLSSFPDNASLLRWAREGHAAIASFLEGLDESSPQLDEPLVMPWADRIAARFGASAAAVTVSETLIQIPSHSTYHRGQVNMRLRELGHEPPLTDFIAWAWFGKPSPEWP